MQQHVNRCNILSFEYFASHGKLALPWKGGGFCLFVGVPPLTSVNFALMVLGSEVYMCICLHVCLYL